MRVNEQIRYETDDKPPRLVTLSVASQGAVIALSNTATLVTIFAVASGSSEAYLSWALFASLVIAGAVTVHQAVKIGRLAPGYLLLMGPGSPFMAVCVLAGHRRWSCGDVKPNNCRVLGPFRARIVAGTTSADHHASCLWGCLHAHINSRNAHSHRQI